MLIPPLLPIPSTHALSLVLSVSILNHNFYIPENWDPEMLWTTWLRWLSCLRLAWAAIANHHRHLGKRRTVLNEQKFVFSQSKVWEVQDQGACRLGSLWETAFPALRVAIFSLCAHRHLSPDACAERKRLEPYPYELLNLNHLLKALSPNTITLGVRALAYELRGGGVTIPTIVVSQFSAELTADL